MEASARQTRREERMFDWCHKWSRSWNFPGRMRGPGRLPRMSCKNSLPGEHLRSNGEIALNQWYSTGEQLAVSGRWALADIHLRPFKAIRCFMRFPVVLATGI